MSHIGQDISDLDTALSRGEVICGYTHSIAIEALTQIATGTVDDPTAFARRILNVINEWPPKPLGQLTTPPSVTGHDETKGDDSEF